MEPARYFSVDGTYRGVRERLRPQGNGLIFTQTMDWHSDIMLASAIVLPAAVPDAAHNYLLRLRRFVRLER